LANAGSIAFGPDSIEFPQAPELEQPLDAIGQGRGSILIPRRLLRFLVAQASPAVIAAALAVLLRCLSRRKNGFDTRGRIKASWVATLFDVDLRRVKAARAELLRLGWIDQEPSDQRAENRWGRAFRINLAWERHPGARLPPLPPESRRAFATPSVDPAPLREENQHQEPAQPAGSGFQIGAGEGEKSRPSINPADRGPKSPVPAPVSADLPAPRLDDVRPEDLASVGRLLELHGQAIDRGLVGGSEADRLKFVALGEHARLVGKTNPGGLFAALLRRGAWAYITQGEEDAARRKLRAHLWGLPQTIPGSGSKVRPRVELSVDARTVREVSRALSGAGYWGDMFLPLRRRDASWTRARWDAALLELNGSGRTFR
jgi:hypothetical protein